MTKAEQRGQWNSPFNKSKPESETFFIDQEDPAAPFTIRFYISERIRLGLNHETDWSIIELENVAARMESAQKKGPSQSDYEPNSPSIKEYLDRKKKEQN